MSVTMITPPFRRATALSTAQDHAWCLLFNDLPISSPMTHVDRSCSLTGHQIAVHPPCRQIQGEGTTSVWNGGREDQDELEQLGTRTSAHSASYFSAREGGHHMQQEVTSTSVMLVRPPKLNGTYIWRKSLRLPTLLGDGAGRVTLSRVHLALALGPLPSRSVGEVGRKKSSLFGVSWTTAWREVANAEEAASEPGPSIARVLLV